MNLMLGKHYRRIKEKRGKEGNWNVLYTCTSPYSECNRLVPQTCINESQKQEVSWLYVDAKGWMMRISVVIYADLFIDMFGIYQQPEKLFDLKKWEGAHNPGRWEFRATSIDLDNGKWKYISYFSPDFWGALCIPILKI